MIKHAIYVAIASCLAASFLCSDVMALDNIIRPYQSARSSGMGGTRITTGLYDDNFFGNPARVTANPTWRVSLFDLTAELTSQTPATAKKLLDGGSDVLNNIASTAGKNNHGRIETTMPSVYIPHLGKMSYALGLLSSTQFDVDLRNNYSVEPSAILDVGPAFTVGRTFLEDDTLSIGVTAHATYRVATKPGFSFVDIIQGKSLSPTQSGGDGSHLDVDLGGTYVLPVAPIMDWKLATGASINNILGGKYGSLPIHPIKDKTGLAPMAQPRSFNLGVSANRESLWKFTDTLVALELTDIGNNPNGGFFRLVHIGGETHWGILAPRLGINQGYLAAGLGINLKVLTLDLATYGEEMTLNPGGLEDRRYVIHLGIQI